MNYHGAVELNIPHYTLSQHLRDLPGTIHLREGTRLSFPAMAKAATFSHAHRDSGPAREVEVEVIPPSQNGRARPDSGPRRGPGGPSTEVRPGTGMSQIISFLLDDLFRVPGTKIRFGLDPLIGLIPGLGDIAAGSAASLILISGATQGVPRLILARMCGNIMLNSALGAIPGVGDAFSFWFKSNARNHALLLKHMGKRKVAGKGDLVFVGILLGLVALTVFLALVGLVAMVNMAGNFWFGR